NFPAGNHRRRCHVLQLKPRRMGALDMSVCRGSILLLLFLWAGISDDELARNGKIREDAPVKASVQIVIHAPVEKVWSLLTDIAGWPKWQSDISTAEITGPLQAG